MRYLRIASLGAIVVLGAACSDQRPMVDRLDGLETTVGEMSAQSTHTIETIVDAGQGSIDCGPPTVQAGDTVTCTITPAYQYLLDELQDNSENVIEAVGPDLKYVIENVQRSHTIRVRFANLPTLRFRAEPPARLRVWSWGGLVDLLRFSRLRDRLGESDKHVRGVLRRGAEARGRRMDGPVQWPVQSLCVPCVSELRNRGALAL